MKLQSLMSLFLLLTFVTTASGEPPRLFQRMFSGAAKPMPEKNQGARQLAIEDGPWMILAHTFVGPNSESKAERLAEELSRGMKLPTFIYQEKFDFTSGPKARAGETRRVRYANPHQYEAHAVLVGEYDSVEHPNAEGDLQKIKSATPSLFG
ncbi:MAG: hypothetical protein AAF989_04295, partial [Planctomycetota bacterium]